VYVVSNTDQIYHLFNESKKLTLSYNKGQGNINCQYFLN